MNDMMNMILLRLPLLLVVLSILLQVSVVVDAFPAGPGACAANRAAVEGPHLATPARQTGPIGNARLQMVLDDTIVLRTKDWVNFTVGVDHTLTLQKINGDGTSFRGFLFRLGPGDNDQIDTTSALVQTTPDASVVFQCVTGQGVGGLGHTNSLLKEEITATLRMDEIATNMPLDVTIVIQHRYGLSEFYYQQFLLNAVTGPTGPGGPAPAKNPTIPPLPPGLPPAFTQNFPPAIPPSILPPAMLQPTVPATEPTTAPIIPPPTTPTDTTEAPISVTGTTAPIAMAPTTPAPVPSPTTPSGDNNPGTQAPIPPQTKVAPQAKCGSLAGQGDRGGAASDAKDCTNRRRRADFGTRRLGAADSNTNNQHRERRRRRKLKGSSY